MHQLFIGCLLLAGMFAGGCNTGKHTQTPEPANPDTATGKSYSYSDGSGNGYRISKDSFEYIPVKPAESSTGRYDGGDPVKNQPGDGLFNEVAELILAASADTKEHTPHRNKGAPSITIRDGSSSSSFILKMGSPWIFQIETVLAKMKTKK